MNALDKRMKKGMTFTSKFFLFLLVRKSSEFYQWYMMCTMISECQTQKQCLMTSVMLNEVFVSFLWQIFTEKFHPPQSDSGTVPRNSPARRSHIGARAGGMTNF